jgi:hypothetical protein
MNLLLTPVLLALVTSEPTPTPVPAPAAAEPSVASVPERTDDRFAGRRTDVGMDQAFLAPTALTQPAMSLTVHDHELAVLGATFAPVERWQITIAAMPPWVFNIPKTFNAAVSTKLRLLDVSRLHVALIGGAGWLALNRLIVGGVVASVCLDDTCASVVSAHGLAGPKRGKLDYGGESHSIAVAFGASGIFSVHRAIKIVTEAHVGGLQNCNLHCTDDVVGTLLGFAGLRFHVRSFAATVGVAVAAESSMYYVTLPGTATTPMERRWSIQPLPAGSVSFRFGGS